MSRASTISAIQLVVDALMASTAVQALVGNRVHGSFARDSDLQTIPKPSIVVEAEGGSAMLGGPATLGITVHVLSAVGLDEAYAIYDAAREVVHNEALCHATNGHRGVATEVVAPAGGWIAGAACWWVAGRYTLVVVRS